MDRKPDPDNVNVFDLDGTLISVDSFVDITKLMLISLFKRVEFSFFIPLFFYCALRKLNLISHLNFRRKVVDIFDKAFNEDQKQDMVSKVFSNNIIKSVYDILLRSDNCIISTASPFAFTSRMNFRKDVLVISSLMPNDEYPSPLNLSEGKIANLKYYFGNNDIRIVNFYTDSKLDGPLIDLSLNAFMCSKDGCLTKIK